MAKRTSTPLHLALLRGINVVVVSVDGLGVMFAGHEQSVRGLRDARDRVAATFQSRCIRILLARKSADPSDRQVATPQAERIRAQYSARLPKIAKQVDNHSNGTESSAKVANRGRSLDSRSRLCRAASR